jgi:hypothetical protein
MNDLIKELEAATEGSAELDLKVMKALDWIPKDCRTLDVVNGNVLWDMVDGEEGNTRLRRFTRSLDATENALPDGWIWLQMQNEFDCWQVECVDETKEDWAYIYGKAISLPIARTIAVLKVYQGVRSES